MKKNANLKIEYLPIDALTPYEKNARKHADFDVEQIAASIERYGFDDPIGVWGEKNIIVEGHGRLLAAKKLGMESVPCVRLDHLTEKERREYAIAHNRTAELSLWESEFLRDERAELDMDWLNFDGIDSAIDFSNGKDFFENKQKYAAEGGNEEYDEFLDKFVPKKTTDDCYTPDNIYDAVCEWVESEYSVKRSQFVRPFYPSGDYQKFQYGKDSIVVDNPPFSILSEIIRFYQKNRIKFFLFADTRSLFTATDSKPTYIATNAAVRYENGAVVNTSFITNLDAVAVRTAADLSARLKAANKGNEKAMHKDLRKNAFPNNVITSTMVGRFGLLGVDYSVTWDDVFYITALDEQKESGTGIFGGGFLISDERAAERAAAERAAAERAAAERAAATKWKLSERELEIIASLGKKGNEGKVV